jgi:hypothetical protein
MIQKKVCMLGGFAVGKTSLVRRFVHSIFSDKYLTTLGVKIDRKVVSAHGRELNLMLWDIHGEDEFAGIINTYLRGTSGFLLVVDGTRRATLDTAVTLRRRVVETVGDIPFVLLLNKVDLGEEWDIDEPAVDKLRQAGWLVRDTSAKTGQGVEEAFLVLAEKLSPA